MSIPVMVSLYLSLPFLLFLLGIPFSSSSMSGLLISFASLCLQWFQGGQKCMQDFANWLTLHWLFRYVSLL